MEGLTLDTGALVGLERGDVDVFAILEIGFRGGVRVTVPSVVVAEWWRGGRGRSLRMLDPFVVEPVDFQHARMAGEALATVGKGPSVIDAIVMASAARRGDRVVTGDYKDLDRLRRAFPGVRLVPV